MEQQNKAEFQKCFCSKIKKVKGIFLVVGGVDSLGVDLLKKGMCYKRKYKWTTCTKMKVKQIVNLKNVHTVLLLY